VIAPELTAAHIALGSLLERRGRHAEAVAEYLSAAKRGPKNALAHRRVGVARYRLGEFNKALAEFRQAAALGDSSDELTYYLGLAAFQCSDLTTAASAWAELHERHSGDQRLILNLNRLHYLLGRQRLEAGKLDEAIAEWTKYLEPRPEDQPMKKDIAKLHFRLALSHHGRDGASALADMREDLHRALTLDPEEPVYRYYVALCDALDGRWSEFARAVQQLLPTLSATVRPLASRHLGIALLAQNDLSKAEPLLRQAREEGAKAGMAVDVNWPLAVLYAKSGRWTEAAALLSEQPAVAQG
jgi:tetratricopeptide (TPR) repeat protein